MQEIPTNACYTGMDSLNLRFGFFPVAAEFFPAAQSLLRFTKRLFVSPETVQWFNIGPIGKGGEAYHSHVDPHVRCGRMNGGGYLPLGLDAHKPLAAGLAHGDVSDLAWHFAAFPVTYPAELGQEDAVVGLIQTNLPWIGIPKTVLLPFFPEPGEIGPPGEEIGVGPFQVFQALLQGVNRRFGKPCGFRIVPPLSEPPAKFSVAEFFLAFCISFLLQSQCPVKNIPAGPGKELHLPFLLPLWLQSKFESLPSSHDFIILLAYE